MEVQIAEHVKSSTYFMEGPFVAQYRPKISESKILNMYTIQLGIYSLYPILTRCIHPNDIIPATLLERCV